jgi:crotonobetainyl-CoA:carnitine CoA-transferase CaiB-like acyl-CoA transferase
MTGGPLAGTRGIVLTQAWAGTYCTELLAFLGADVIQIEVRKRPDSWRGGYDTPLAKELEEVSTAKHPWNCSALYNSVNLNKRCVTLDLQTERGVDVFKCLLPFADFVAENFSPRVLGNLGLDYDAMRAIKPDVILCSLSAYGATGPWRNIPGIGGTIEPTSGMSALLGYEDGPPLNSGQMYPDAAAGILGLGALMTALHHRDRTGEGQYIDLSMQEANLCFVGDAALEYELTGVQRPRMGNKHPNFAPHGIYPCQGDDRWIAIACETEEQWKALAKFAALGWGRDYQFAVEASRKANEPALDAAIAHWTLAHSRDALAEQLAARGVIAAPVVDADELAADPNLRQRGVITDVTHPETGSWPHSANPFTFSDVENPPVRPAPLHGEHTEEVLAELLGTTHEEYERLVADGVSGMGPPD